MEYEERQEASIPVASRVNLVTMAELVGWFESADYRIKSVSQLISWSMDLLRDTLRANGKIPDEEMSLADANRFMNYRNLYQKGVRERGKQKLATGIRFESMRKEGIDPKDEHSTHYNMVHNERSVEPLSNEEQKSKYEEEWQKAKITKQQEMYEKAREDARRAMSQPANLKEGASKEELERKMAEIEERDRLRAEEFKKADLLFTGDDK